VEQTSEFMSQECLQHSEVNWLLNRAAHQLREAMDVEASVHGITIRAQIVLTALVQQERTTGGKPVSQLALGAALGVDKTTMTAMLDKLERQGLVVRTPDPNDRRARIPVITETGRELQAKVYTQLRTVEDRMLTELNADERDQLRGLLRRVISNARVDGSCM
jgi:DNA-binding MarR family transcriptional regulator